MNLYKFLLAEATEGWSRFLCFAVLAALANASVLHVINTQALADSINGWLIVLFFLAAALYAFCYEQCMGQYTLIVEGALFSIRVRLAEKIAATELKRFEHIGAAEIYDQILQQTTIISIFSWMICSCMLAVLAVGALTLYLGYLSLGVLALLVGVFAVAAPIYLRRTQRTRALWRETNTLQTRLFDGLTDFLQGFKEVRLSARRSQALADDFCADAEVLKQGALEIHAFNQGNYLFVNLAMFLVLAASVFVLPQYASANVRFLAEVTAIIVFMLSPVATIFNTMPDFERSNLAAETILEVERRLDQAVVALPEVQDDPWGGRFSEIEVRDLRYSHTNPDGQPGFSIGPLSFSIRAGEIVFLVGGNGSGKTTLLKLLTTLYHPTAGALLVDGVPVTSQNLLAYRELLTTIFTDFHLFKKLYGLSGVAADEVARRLTAMGIAASTALSGGQFTNLNLSTGQRKRLAMVVALLEDRPLNIFDEWAADQDPQFRQYYYDVLLPELKHKGKTILAISHDDRYFHCADRVITMEYGVIRSVTERPPLAPTAGALAGAEE